MTAKGNSVNIAPAKPRYHHGDLRSSVMAEGMRLLGERSVEDLSLREIARNVGVSATAVYRHFPEKQALLAALAEEGAERMADFSRAALKGKSSPQEMLDAMGVAYVRFALENPAVFRLMLVHTRLGAGRADSSAGLAKLFDAVAAISPSGASEAERRVGVAKAWSLVHGLAMLMLDGQLPRDEALIRRVVCWN